VVQLSNRFLMQSQLGDGSCFVTSRAIPLQPHFESGFPRERDQFISAAATNWATMALSLAIRPSDFTFVSFVFFVSLVLLLYPE